MKRSLFLVITMTALGLLGNAQNRKPYWTSGGELIFAFNSTTDSGASVDRGMRFSLFFHINERFNVDFNRYSGFSIGAGIRNIGFVTKNQEGPNTRITRRSYTAGIPVMFKFGDMANDKYFFVGGEYELFFHYKEKFCIGRDRVAKNTEWFSDKTKRLMPSVFAGYQASEFLNIKFQMYLDNFMNQDYTETVNNVQVKPYQYLKTPVFFFSLSSNVRNVSKERRKEMRKKKEENQPLPQTLRFR